MTALGREIKKALVDRGELQMEFAERLGLSDNYMSLIIRGHRTPQWRVVAKMRRELNLDLNLIADEDGPC